MADKEDSIKVAIRMRRKIARLITARVNFP